MNATTHAVDTLRQLADDIEAGRVPCHECYVKHDIQEVHGDAWGKSALPRRMEDEGGRTLVVKYRVMNPSSRSRP